MMKIAVVGVGNILLKDEGVGVRVVQQLENKHSFPSSIALIDGGTAGPHLLDIFNDFDDIIIIDAVKGGGEPGSIYKFRSDQISIDPPTSLSIHEMGVLEVINQARLMGKEPRVTFIGIEPQDSSPWGMELSPLIAEKIPEVIALVLNELSQRDMKA
jgi:hydrogenase maturation protease